MKVRDFYNIGDMSKEFEEYDSEEKESEMQRVQMWQARCLLAIAQQLSVVAAHLGKITRKAEELNDKD
jgi:hypothetical protein